MPADFHVSEFSGPLDMLLQLIEEKELDITTIALAEVSEQFLNYLQTVEESHPEELADFLVVATKLLLIKSRELLPYLHIEDEEDPQTLAKQLVMYKKYAEAAGVIEQLISEHHFLYGKIAHKEPLGFLPPEGVTVETLQQYFVDILSKLEPVVRIPKAAIQKVITLREKFTQIQQVIEQHATVHFKELLSESHDRAEVVVTFLALLELVKKQMIHVDQKDAFAEIVVHKVS